jgi:hypothetical protein
LNDLARYEAAVQEAVEACKESGLPQYKGLAYERASFVFAISDSIKAPERYFDRAMVAYGEEWGSNAKCEWLRRKTNIKLSTAPSQPNRIWGKQIEVPQKAVAGDIIAN